MLQVVTKAPAFSLADQNGTIHTLEEYKGKKVILYFYPKLVTKGTYAKMARGEMVRYMAEKEISEIEEIKGFDWLGYVYREDISSESEFVFERT